MNNSEKPKIISRPTEETLQTVYEHNIKQYLNKIDIDKVGSMEKLNTLRKIRNDVYGSKDNTENLFSIKDIEAGKVNGYFAIKLALKNRDEENNYMGVYEVKNGVIIGREDLDMSTYYKQGFFAETKKDAEAAFYNYYASDDDFGNHNEQDDDYNDEEDYDTESELDIINRENSRI